MGASGVRRTSLRVAVFIIVATLGAPGLATAQERDLPDGDCSLPTTGVTPLNDLGTAEYQGYQGGLYPGGSNVIPETHHAFGITVANEIVPRNQDGEPDAAGVIGFVSIGVSNTFREFEVFRSQIGAQPTLNPAVRIANAAQGGAHITSWLDPRSRNWTVVDEVIAEAGLSAAQVQALWIKLPERIDVTQPLEEFPGDALTHRDELVGVLQMLRERFPNLEIAYLSSRIYGGYNITTSPSPEPIAYQHGFGVKWTIEAQIEGDPALDFAAGDVPWIAWGPYMWADGTTPRSDGLVWNCRDIRGDGVHPSGRGSEKVAGLLIDFLRDEPTAGWMWTDREVPSPTVAITTTTAAATTSSTTPVITTAPSDEPRSESRVTTTALPPVAADRGNANKNGSGDGPGLATWVAIAVAVAAAGAAGASALRRSSG